MKEAKMKEKLLMIVAAILLTAASVAPASAHRYWSHGHWVWHCHGHVCH